MPDEFDVSQYQFGDEYIEKIVREARAELPREIESIAPWFDRTPESWSRLRAMLTLRFPGHSLDYWDNELTNRELIGVIRALRDEQDRLGGSKTNLNADEAEWSDWQKKKQCKSVCGKSWEAFKRTTKRPHKYLVESNSLNDQEFRYRLNPDWIETSRNESRTNRIRPTD